MNADKLSGKKHKLTTGYLSHLIIKMLERKGIKIEVTASGEEADSIDGFLYLNPGQEYLVIGDYANRGKFVERKGNQLVFDKFTLDYQANSEITMSDSITIEDILKA
ncbi:hypothetical protein HYW20_05370 [Candidatus Woesearchaeota archaeon]|nr:hypothetical protein [Candidatus Woesearchaeota archaeon]